MSVPPPVMSMRWTMGSSTSWGRLDRIEATALRTSLVARSTSTPMLNSIEVVETPSFTVE